MRILMIAPTPFFSDRGTHIRILEEALALEKQGHIVTIATYHIGRDIHSEIKTNIEIRRILRLLFWYKKLEAGPDWQKIILDIMLIRKAFYLARTQKADIIHGHLHEGVLIGWFVQKLLFWKKIKLVADFHGSLTAEMISHNYLKGGFLQTVFKKIERFIDNLGDYAISSSTENTQEISKVRRSGKIETVIDGVNLESYRELPPKDFLKKELELPSDKIIVTYAGALVPNKGIKYFLEAITLVLNSGANAYFVIAGFPMQHIQDYINRKNLSGKVRLISPLSYFDLPKILGASDIAIDPKDSATLQASGKILQYMGAGLPIVCFDRKNNRDYLEDCAYFSREISAEGIAEGIKFLIENAAERENIGKKCGQRAQNFSWENSAKKVEKIYNQLTETK